MNASLHTPARADGALARRRLLEAALHLFAEQGFEKTSTREIADAAGVNLGSINYYFGDKASLYRAVFCESFCETPGPGASEMKPHDCLPDFAASGLGLSETLAQFFGNFLQPLKQGEMIRMVMRLHFRELVEPSGVLQQQMHDDMKPLYTALLALLARHFGLAEPDADVQRLALSVLGLSIHFFVAQDLVAGLAPEITATPESIDTLADRLSLYAMGMIEAEARRRRGIAKAAP